jgi:hypothetical protein
LRVVAPARAGARHGAPAGHVGRREALHEAAAGGDAGAAGGSGESPSGGVTAALDRATNTIRIPAGTGITLERLSKAVGNSAALRELQPGEWMVGANIEIDKGASLTLSAPDVSWVKLHSVGPNYATVKAFRRCSGDQRDLHLVLGRHEAAGRHEPGGRAQPPARPRWRPRALARDSDSGRQPPLLGVAGQGAPPDALQLAASPVVGGAPACGRSARFPASSVAAADGGQIAGLLTAGPGSVAVFGRLTAGSVTAGPAQPRR